MLQDTANQVDRASGTVRNLLDFTRVEKPVSVPLLLCDIVQGAQRLVANEAAINDVEFDIQLPEDLPRIEGNPRDVQQIFLNLYINAIQAMPHGGTLNVRGKARADGNVEVQISDTGVGIPPEDLPSIFDPFFTSKEPGEGTGLGLFVTYGIVQRHHGTIEVSSVVGEGTTFTVSFAAAGASRE
jgi:signal transduction histidine kinase